MTPLHRITSASCYRNVLAARCLRSFLTSMQLRSLVEAGVSQDELAQILAQLRTLVRPTPTNAAPPPSMPPTKYTSAMPYPPSFTYQQTVVPGSSLVHPQYPQLHAPIYPNSAQQFQASDNSRPVAINTVVSSTAFSGIPNISGLFKVSGLRNCYIM